MYTSVLWPVIWPVWEVPDDTRTTGEWVLYGIGLLATLIVTVFVTRLARKALSARFLIVSRIVFR